MARDFMGLSPMVALTTEYRFSLLHRLNLRLPVLDLMYASRSFTLLKKRAVRFTSFLVGLFSTSHPTAWKLQHSPALYALREHRFSVLNGIIYEYDIKKSYYLKKIEFNLAFESK
jgi:hypothetical protein